MSVAKEHHNREATCPYKFQIASTLDQVELVKKALFGEEGRGGVVADVGEIKAQIKQFFEIRTTNVLEERMRKKVAYTTIGALIVAVVGLALKIVLGA